MNKEVLQNLFISRAQRIQASYTQQMNYREQSMDFSQNEAPNRLSHSPNLITESTQQHLTYSTTFLQIPNQDAGHLSPPPRPGRHRSPHHSQQHHHHRHHIPIRLTPQRPRSSLALPLDGQLPLRVQDQRTRGPSPPAEEPLYRLPAHHRLGIHLLGHGCLYHEFGNRLWERRL